MGARRRTVLILLAASLAATALFVGLGVDATDDATPSLASPAQQADDGPTGALDSPSQPGLVEEYPAGGTLGLIYWALAFVSGTVLLVSGLLMRREGREVAHAPPTSPARTGAGHATIPAVAGLRRQPAHVTGASTWRGRGSSAPRGALGRPSSLRALRRTTLRRRARPAKARQGR